MNQNIKSLNEPKHICSNTPKYTFNIRFTIKRKNSSQHNSKTKNKKKNQNIKFLDKIINVFILNTTLTFNHLLYIYIYFFFENRFNLEFFRQLPRSVYSLFAPLSCGALPRSPAFRRSNPSLAAVYPYFDFGRSSKV